LSSDVQTIGSDIEEDEQSMAYKDMKRSYYVGGSFFIWIVEIICGIVVPDLSVAIGYVGAVCVIYLGMILPAWLYLASEAKFNSGYRKRHKCRRISAWLMIIYGVISFVMLMYVNILNSMGKSESSGGH